MSNLIKKGERAFKQNKQKDAINQLSNFASIMEDMNVLADLIEFHEGVVSLDNADEIARNYCKERNLNLTEAQIQIVLKQFKTKDE